MQNIDITLVTFSRLAAYVVTETGVSQAAHDLRFEITAYNAPLCFLCIGASQCLSIMYNPHCSQYLHALTVKPTEFVKMYTH